MFRWITTDSTAIIVPWPLWVTPLPSWIMRTPVTGPVAASIVGYVRQAALGDPLVPYAERVDRAIRTVGARHRLDDVQRRWLEQIGRELKSRVVLDRAALDEPPFAQQGGFRRLERVFNGETEEILREVASETWEPAA